MFLTGIQEGLSSEILYHVTTLQSILGMTLVLTADVDLNVLGQSSPKLALFAALVLILTALMGAMDSWGVGRLGATIYYHDPSMAVLFSAFYEPAPFLQGKKMRGRFLA
jgi:hypothetical protein